jgi:hypothetical protein
VYWIIYTGFATRRRWTILKRDRRWKSRRSVFTSRYGLGL